MHKRKKMWHHKRGLMHLGKDMGHNNSIEVVVLVGWSVVHVESSILRDII